VHSRSTRPRFDALAFAALLMLGGCSQRDEPPATVPPMVVWSELALDDTADSATYAGAVRSRVRTELGFPSGGRLVMRDGDVGDTVRRGDVLATLDDVELAQRVAAARAEVRSAEAQRDGRARDQERIAGLVRQQAVSRAELESAIDDRQAAEAALDAARAHLAGALQRRRDARLVAPFDGVITATGADVGDVVAVGQPVLTVADPARLEVLIDLPSDRSGAVRIGSPVQVIPELRPARIVAGSVARIAPRIDPLSRGLDVTIDIADSVPSAMTDGAGDDTPVIRSGSEVAVRLIDDTARRLRVPKRAVSADGTQVWVLDRSISPVRVRAVPVRVPPDGLLPPTLALAAGDEVVVAGLGDLQDGQAVTPARRGYP